MNTFFTDKFKKYYHKRIFPFKNLRKNFRERHELFMQDPFHPLIADHPLKGSKKGYRAFSITGDIRVVYYIFENTAYFVDIGTHNQVY